MVNVDSLAKYLQSLIDDCKLSDYFMNCGKDNVIYVDLCNVIEFRYQLSRLVDFLKVSSKIEQL